MRGEGLQTMVYKKRKEKSSPKIIFNTKVTFDKAAMINQNHESKVDKVEMDHGAEKQVDLEINYKKMKQEEEDTNQPSTLGTTQLEVEQQDEPSDKDAGQETIETEPQSIVIGRKTINLETTQIFEFYYLCT